MSRQKELLVANKMHQYNYDVNEAIRWIQAKATLLANDDYGKTAQDKIFCLF